jgi:hypothetical protein
MRRRASVAQRGHPPIVPPKRNDFTDGLVSHVWNDLAIAFLAAGSSGGGFFWRWVLLAVGPSGGGFFWRRISQGWRGLPGSA